MSYFPRSVSKQCTKKILAQMEDSFFKVNINENESNVCFFCKIEYKNKKIPVIMINKYLIDLEFINSIVIPMNNELKTFKFGKTRFIDKDFDMSIIEIVDDKIENVDFLEIDDKLYEKEAQMFYYKENIYIIQFDNKRESSVSYGIMNNIINKHIYYYGNLSQSCKSFFIFNLSNNKLIGINSNNPKDSNKGIFLKNTINKFINKYKKNIKKYNEINILIEVNREDVYEKIYILDNGYKTSNGGYYKHNNVKELNDLNTELYINDKKHKYNKYFQPNKKGKYKIKMKFYINLTDCSYMFVGCKNIICINFILFNTCLIKNMAHMFHGCNNLKLVNNLSSFDTKNVIDMQYMFSGCNNLKELNLSSFDTKNVTDMQYMFSGCNNLKELNLSSFNTKNVTDMQYMFWGCINLNELNLSSFNTKKVMFVEGIFYNCPKDIINSNLLYLMGRYNEINILIEINKEDIYKNINVIKNTNELNDLNTELYINDKFVKFNKSFKPEKEGKYEIKLRFYINLTDCSKMFYNCKNITAINFIYFNTRNVICMKYMFCGCNNLRTINNVSSFDTTNVTDMQYMFNECFSLKELNLSSFDTKNVKDMQYMFNGCNNLKELNLLSFDTKNVKDMTGMFYECNNLGNLNLSSFDYENVSYASGIFYNCQKNIINSNLSILKQFCLIDLTKELI